MERQWFLGRVRGYVHSSAPWQTGRTLPEDYARYGGTWRVLLEDVRDSDGEDVADATITLTRTIAGLELVLGDLITFRASISTQRLEAARCTMERGHRMMLRDPRCPRVVIRRHGKRAPQHQLHAA